VERPLRLRGGVRTPERFQNGIVPRLHAHADAIDSKRAEQARFFRGDCRGIDFKSELHEPAGVESFAQAREQKLELRKRECARCPAAEINRLRLDLESASL